MMKQSHALSEKCKEFKDMKNAYQSDLKNFNEQKEHFEKQIELLKMENRSKKVNTTNGHT